MDAVLRDVITRTVAMPEDRRVLIVTEALVAGVDIDLRFDTDEAVRIAEGVVAALDAATDAGILTEPPAVVMGECDMCERKVPRSTLTSRAGFLAFCPECDTGRPGGVKLS